MLFVGGDDALHQRMAHHVASGEFHNGDAFDVPQRAMRFDQAGMFVAGRSICVSSPVMTALELMPSRVRNMNICSVVEFCASSRMMNALLSVRPRM